MLIWISDVNLILDCGPGSMLKESVYPSFLPDTTPPHLATRNKFSCFIHWLTQDDEQWKGKAVTPCDTTSRGRQKAKASRAKRIGRAVSEESYDSR